MLLMGLLIILITGCADPKPIIEYRYVDRIVEKLVPVPCEIPKVTCAIDVNLTYTAKVRQVGECIEDLNKVMEMYK